MRAAGTVHAENRWRSTVLRIDANAGTRIAVIADVASRRDTQTVRYPDVAQSILRGRWIYYRSRVRHAERPRDAGQFPMECLHHRRLEVTTPASEDGITGAMLFWAGERCARPPPPRRIHPDEEGFRS